MSLIKTARLLARDSLANGYITRPQYAAHLRRLVAYLRQREDARRQGFSRRDARE